MKGEDGYRDCKSFYVSKEPKPETLHNERWFSFDMCIHLEVAWYK